MSELAIIEVGYDVFVHDGEVKIGAVREVHKHSIVVYVENGGDFTVADHSVSEVVDGKVVLKFDSLDARLRDAIAHAHDAEDPLARSGFPQPPVE